MDSSALDRRQYQRVAADVECKVLYPAAARYLAARTRDVSSGGVALTIVTHRPLKIGDAVRVAVDWSHQGLLDADGMIRGRVVRADPMLERIQRIAVVFDSPQVGICERASGDAAA